jgi:hypothetical protein
VEIINQQIFKEYMKLFFIKIELFLRRIIQLNQSAEKQDEAVWNGLKKLHKDSEWKSGVYEKDKYIETYFEIAEGISVAYFYMIYDREFHCRVKVVDNFPVEKTTEIFILASHFNNLILSGKVEVNVTEKYVEYHYKCEVIVPLLYRDELHSRMLKHYDLSKDMFWAFTKLVNENEEPALIIADLIHKNENKEGENRE